MPDDPPATGRPFLMLSLLDLESKKGGKRGKPAGSRWVTDHDGHHLLIGRGGQLLAGRGIQAGATWHQKPKPGAGGGSGSGATTAKPAEAPKPAAKPAEAPKPAAPAKPEPAKPVATAKPEPQPVAAKPAPAEPIPAPKQEATGNGKGNARDYNNVEGIDFAKASKEEKEKHFANENANRAGRDRLYRGEFGGWEGNLSDKEKKSLAYYKSDKGYKAINADLRSGKANKQADMIDQALARHSLSEDTVLYRGMRDFKAMNIPTGHAAVGYTHHDRAFQSTSLDFDIGRGFAQRGAADPSKHNAVLKITARKGAKVGGVGTDPNHKFSHEKEVLIGRNSTVKITKYVGFHQGVHVYEAELHDE